MKKVFLLFVPYLITLLLYPFLSTAQKDVSTPVAKEFISHVDTTLENDGLKFISCENYSSITNRKIYSKTLAAKYVPKANQNNPDFGFMPFDSDLQNVYEEIEKRTAHERFFRDQDNPSVIYLQKSSLPINYLKKGNWLSIDPQLKKVDAKHFEASQQPLACGLDIDKKTTTMNDGINSFGFNHFSMLEYDTNGTPIAYTANWQNYTVGDNGILVNNIFPGINMIIQFSEHTIKSNFILLHSRPGSSRIVFTDSLKLPEEYTIGKGTGKMEAKGFLGDISINDKSGKSQYIYGQVNITDNAHDKLELNGYYTFSENALDINVYADVFNNAGITYPLTVDPIVTYGAFNAAANTIGAAISPATCANALVVSVPGGATCTDFSASWNITNTSNACGCAGAQNCRLDKDQVYITSSCGGATPAGAPGTIWRCLGCNFLGTWNPALPFGSSGCTSMATCIPPSCSAQNITFTFFLNQFGCTGATCGSCSYATNTCAHLNSWSVTIQAHTLEVLGNVAGSGTSNITGSCGVNSTLDPAALYGVPSYSYSWNPGATASPTLVVNQSVNGTFTYTATVTDACGTAQTANFNFTVSDCPLPIELLNFDAIYNGKSVDTKWSTASETNNDYFTVERTIDGITYKNIGLVKSAAPGGNSSSVLSYSLNDPDVKTGTYYYRLKQTDFNGHYEYSSLVPVVIDKGNDAFTIVPNPAHDIAEIMYTLHDDLPSLLKITDTHGKMVFSESIENKKGKNKYTINLSKYAKGVYFIRLVTSASTFTSKLVKQ